MPAIRKAWEVEIRYSHPAEGGVAVVDLPVRIVHTNNPEVAAYRVIKALPKRLRLLEVSITCRPVS